jgi:hypothetical protein
MENLPVEARPEKEQKGHNPNQKKAPGSSGNDRGRKDREKESPKRHEEAPGRTTPPSRPAREENPRDEGRGRGGDGRNRDVERDRDQESGVDEG